MQTNTSEGLRQVQAWGAGRQAFKNSDNSYHLLNADQSPASRTRAVLSRNRRTQVPGPQALLCHFGAVGLQMGYVMPLRLSFLLYELEVSDGVHSQDRCVPAGKACRSVGEPHECYVCY